MTKTVCLYYSRDHRDRQTPATKATPSSEEESHVLAAFTQLEDAATPTQNTVRKLAALMFCGQPGKDGRAYIAVKDRFTPQVVAAVAKKCDMEVELLFGNTFFFPGNVCDMAKKAFKVDGGQIVEILRGEDGKWVVN